MDTSQFLAEFGTIAAAPNGVQRLREMILQLAVMGKLVPQDPADEPASVLLQRIAAEKDRLIRDGKIKRPKPLPAIRDDEKPFELPHGWEWSYLTDILALITDGDHQPPPKADKGIPFLVIGNLNTGKIQFEGCRFVSDEYYQALDWGRKPIKDDILYTVTGSYGIPISVDSDKDFCIQRHVAILKITSSSPRDYLRQLLASKYAMDYATKVATGTAQKTVPLGGLRQMLIPLPPLEEQKRIVAKVDSLMALCDKLEMLQQQRQQLDPMTQTAVLDALLPSPLAGEGLGMGGSSAWQRLNQHMTTLFHTPESVKALRETILQLAVMGKLVPQDPNDEPAAVLLQHIAAEKDRLIQEGKIKRQKPLPAIRDDEKPFELPSGWEWTPLQNIVLLLGDGLHGTPEYDPNGCYFFVNGNNFENGKIIIKPNTKKVDKNQYEKYKKNLTNNTVLVSINGTLGNVAFYNNEPIVLGKSACFFNLNSMIFKFFIKTIIESPIFIDYAINNSTGTTINNLGLKAMNSFPIALPPEKEQQRIVAKVDSLMALCDKLETRLQAARETARLFAAEAVATM